MREQYFKNFKLVSVSCLPLGDSHSCVKEQFSFEDIFYQMLVRNIFLYLKKKFCRVLGLISMA